MKKLLVILIAALTLFGAAHAERPQSTRPPEEYNMILVTDIFTNTDAEAGEKGDFPETEPQLTLQGTFGTIDMSHGEWDMEFIGFDLKEVYSFSLADDCVLLMPADLANPVENALCKDLQAWYDAACKKLFDNFYFYAYYKLNDKDELTRLEYVYLP